MSRASFSKKSVTIHGIAFLIILVHTGLAVLAEHMRLSKIKYINGHLSVLESLGCGHSSSYEESSQEIVTFEQRFRCLNFCMNSGKSHQSLTIVMYWFLPHVNYQSRKARTSQWRISQHILPVRWEGRSNQLATDDLFCSLKVNLREMLQISWNHREEQTVFQLDGRTCVQ